MRSNYEKTERNNDNFSDTYASIVNVVISLFTILITLVFPLIYNNSYIDILVFKYRFYWGCVVAMLALCLFFSIIMLVIDISKNGGQRTKSFFSRLLPKNWRKTLCAADIWVIMFWIMLVISTLQSDYFYESFWGNEGRYSGLFLLTLYVATYFMISRFWKVKVWILDLFLLSGIGVCYVGITDYFRMDILNFRYNIAPEHWDIFTSTIGNINFYTAYIAMVLGVAAAWFTITKSKVRAIWCYLCMVICFFAIIMGSSDNAYLALAALFGFLPLILFKSKIGIRRYLLMIATFGTVIQCIDFINQAYADTVIGLDGLFNILTNFNGLIYAVAGLWLAYIVVCLLSKNSKSLADPAGSVLVYSWAGFLLVSVLLVGSLMFHANMGGNAERYGALGKYLVFNDSWGTNRGYIWRKSFELYKDFKPMHKLFGHGADTFGILTVSKLGAEMPERFENAHNEYLQYFITIGPMGLISYVAFLGSAVARMWKSVGTKPYIIGCCFAIICYIIQAVVNISVPITSPVMWLLLSMGMAACNQRNID